jgi:hypothetical protein
MHDLMAVLFTIPLSHVPVRALSSRLALRSRMNLFRLHRQSEESEAIADIDFPACLFASWLILHPPLTGLMMAICAGTDELLAHRRNPSDINGSIIRRLLFKARHRRRSRHPTSAHPWSHQRSWISTSTTVFARACPRCDLGRNMSHASDRQRYTIIRQRFDAAGPDGSRTDTCR